MSDLEQIGDGIDRFAETGTTIPRFQYNYSTGLRLQVNQLNTEIMWKISNIIAKNTDIGLANKGLGIAIFRYSKSEQDRET